MDKSKYVYCPPRGKRGSEAFVTLEDQNFSPKFCICYTVRYDHGSCRVIFVSIQETLTRELRVVGGFSKKRRDTILVCV